MTRWWSTHMWPAYIFLFDTHSALFKLSTTLKILESSHKYPCFQIFLKQTNKTNEIWHTGQSFPSGNLPVHHSAWLSCRSQILQGWDWLPSFSFLKSYVHRVHVPLIKMIIHPCHLFNSYYQFLSQTGSDNLNDYGLGLLLSAPLLNLPRVPHMFRWKSDSDHF